MKHLRLALLTTVSGLAALLAVACSGDTIVNPATTAEGISVQGSGRASGTPDVVFLQLGVNLERATVSEAREAAASAMQAVIDSLRRNGIAERDIQTSQFSVQPQYDFSTRVQTLRGYRVTNVVTAKITQIATASKAIDDAAAAGGNAAIVQSIDFSIDDPTELQEQARADAMAQARQRAAELADHAGVRILRPISINENYQTVIPQAQTVARTQAPGADVATPIQAGELEVLVFVSVVYAIE
jgi:uncharacterized protein YggE